MLEFEILDLSVRFFGFFSKFENSYGSYFWYAFRKNTKISNLDF